MILVVGASGSLGGKIVRGLLDRGEVVRALVRPGRPHDSIGREGATVVVGDLRDRLSLDRACEGATAVVTTASASKTADDSIENVDVRGNENLIAAAEAAAVERFVFISTLNASVESPVPVFRAKGMTEQRLRQSRLVHTILQPNAFMDVWFPMLVERPAFSGQPVTLVGESRRRHAFIAERDVAAFAVSSLRAAAARNATLPLGGPEAVTLKDVVRAYAEAVRRSFDVRSVAPGEPIPGAPEVVWGLAAALETFDSPVPMEETCRTFGVTLTSVAEFARSRAAARAMS